MAFCSKCGTKLEEGVNFCTNCGTKVEKVMAQQQINVNAPPQSTYQQRGHTGGTVAAKSIWEYFAGAFKKYAVFAGRARRAEYWGFVVVNGLVSLATMFIDNQAGLIVLPELNIGLLNLIYGIVVFLPGWGVGVRRYHDVDKRAWWVLVPIYGWFLPFFAGTVGPNRFGSDPKQVSA
jgi:uncharacterized membrane protein YhaH (DUF805 family)